MVVTCLAVRIIHFISCDWIMNSSLSDTIYLNNCWVRLLLNYNIKYACTIYTRFNVCLMSISRFFLPDKVTLRLFKLHFYGVDVVEWSRAIDIRQSNFLLQCINGVRSNPVERRTQIWQMKKNLMLALHGLIFRRI
jgi:hypothetical protein